MDKSLTVTSLPMSDICRTKNTHSRVSPALEDTNPLMIAVCLALHNIRV